MKIIFKNLKNAYKFIQNLVTKKRVFSDKRNIKTKGGNYIEGNQGNYIERPSQVIINNKPSPSLDIQSFEFYIIIPDDYPYWLESEKSIMEPYPFKYPCKQYFYLSQMHFAENIQPYFDIVFSNKTNEPILLTHVGIEIVSVYHVAYEYGIPECIEIKIKSDNVITMPDICTRLGNQFMRRNHLDVPSPVNLNEVIHKRMSSPFQLEHQAVFRYTLLLEKYQEHMPNNSILRMYAKTSNDIEFRSHDIHLFTL
ncbi:MAG: hypothetical protein HC836_39655 [Richelia sp. RM2_1_2]|nr:hypothetical protein [Richelia sp. RM1_1_1]NJO64082.1 hypothetical protein [Richelia sp. RM2_1_2]